MNLFKKKDVQETPKTDDLGTLPQPEKPKEIEHKSIRQEINDLKDMFNNPQRVREMIEQSRQYQKFLKKQKNFKIPGRVMNEAKKAYKKNKILIVLLKTDRSLQFIIGQIINGMVFIGNTPHQASMDFTFIYNNIPVLIIPEWSLTPIGTKDYYEAVKEKKTTEAATIVIRAIEAKETDMTPKKAPGKMLIWLLIGAAALIGIMFFLNKK